MPEYRSSAAGPLWGYGQSAATGAGGNIVTDSTDESRRADTREPLGADFIIPLLSLRPRGLLPRDHDRSGLGGARRRRRGRRAADRSCASSTWGARSIASCKGSGSFGFGDLFANTLFNRQRLALGLLIAAFIAALPWTGTTLGLFLVLIAGMWTLGVTSIRQLLLVAAIDRRGRLCAADLPREQPAAARPGRVADRLDLRDRGLTVDVPVSASCSNCSAARSSLWWVILPGMMLGTIVGILPGFSAQNTLIILLPLTLYMQHRGRHGLDDLALLHHAARRRHPGDPVQHAGRRRRRRDRARRLSDDQEGPGAAGAGLLLRGLGLRRAHHHHHHDGDAAGARPSSASTSAASRWWR